jgi:hypothetical protein
VGASSWDYRVTHAGSVEATLIALQEQILESGEYLWPWDLEYRNPSYLAFMERFRRESGMPAMPPREGVPRPSSLAGLNAVKEETEEFWDEGTHSILDIERVATAEDDGNPFGTIHPLTPAELAEVFGTSQPSAADFDRVHQPGAGGRLLDLRVERWTGRSVVIYKDGVPAEVFFWGFSGD